MNHSKLWTIAAAAALALPLVMAQAAGAATAPTLACGSTQPGPCSQTAHFTNINDVGTPLPPTAGCPAVLSVDYVTMVGTGHGIEHTNVNKAQDGWFTSTFTGTATIIAYPPSSVTLDSNGNPTITGPVDSSVPAYTGKITEWFGGSFNNKDAVQHSTFHFSGKTATGQTIRVGVVQHASWAPGADQNGPPSKSFAKVSCS
jgi:hypothetical protein